MHKGHILSAKTHPSKFIGENYFLGKDLIHSFNFLFQRGF